MASVVRVGCAMWAHREWIGRHLPADTPQGSELAAYATWCTAVEGNTTFYATPSESTVHRWRADAPDGFWFCFKLPREVTHDRRLRNAEATTEAFLDRLTPIGDRLGPLQIQLPPSFAADDLPALDHYLGWVTQLDTDLAWAVELRHPDFFVGGDHERRVDDLLAGHAASRVILDSRALFDRPPETPEEHDAWEKKPKLPVRPIATSDHPVVRLIGNRDLDASLDRWRQWLPVLVRWMTEGGPRRLHSHAGQRRRTAARSTVPPELGVAAAEVGLDLAPLPDARTTGAQLDLWAEGSMAADRPGSG